MVSITVCRIPPDITDTRPHLPCFSPGTLIKLLLPIIHVGCFVFQKTSIIMYYQVGGATPLSSMSAMTGRAVWIMQLSQLSLSFSHALLHSVHVDGCYSTAISLLFCEKGNAYFETKMNCSSLCACTPVSCVIVCIKISLQHVSAWPQIASVQDHLGDES